MNRRTPCSLVLIAMVTLGLIAGSSGLAAEIELTVTICCGQQDRLDWIASVAEEYMALNPRVKVNTINASLEQVTTMIAGGAGPDLIWTGQSWGSQIPYFAPLTHFLETNPQFARDLVPGMTQGFTFAGETYAIPFSASTRAVAFNEDLLASAGIAPPDASWTWDDALAIARSVTHDANGDGLPETWGIALNWQPWSFLSYGGSIYKNNDRDANLMDDVKLHAMQIFQDVWSGNILVMPSGYVGEPTPHPDLFIGGRLAMWDIGIFDLPRLRSEVSFAWDVTEFPQLAYGGELYRGGAWTGEGYALYKGSKHPDEALEFAKFMLSAQKLTALARTGSILPASIPVLEEVYLTSPPPPANLRAFINPIDYAGAPWAHPAFGLVMQYMFHPVFNTDPPHNGSEPMITIMERAQAALQRALDEFYAANP